MKEKIRLSTTRDSNNAATTLRTICVPIRSALCSDRVCDRRHFSRKSQSSGSQRKIQKCHLLWIPAPICRLQSKREGGKEAVMNIQHATTPFIMVKASQLLVSVDSTRAQRSMFNFGLARWRTHFTSLFCSFTFSLLQPGGCRLCSSIIKTKFITSAKGHRLFSLRDFPCSGCCCCCVTK